MAEQIKVDEVLEKMGEIINEQKVKGYKPGWCSYQIKDWQYANTASLFWLDTNLSYEIVRAAKGESKSADLREEWEESYEMYVEMAAAYS